MNGGGGGGSAADLHALMSQPPPSMGHLPPALQHHLQQQQHNNGIGSSNKHFDENLDIDDDGLIGYVDERVDEEYYNNGLDIDYDDEDGYDENDFCLDDNMNDSQDLSFTTLDEMQNIELISYVNNFSLKNSFAWTLGTLMQSTSDLYPKVFLLYFFSFLKFQTRSADYSIPIVVIAPVYCCVNALVVRMKDLYFHNLIVKSNRSVDGYVQRTAIHPYHHVIFYRYISLFSVCLLLPKCIYSLDSTKQHSKAVSLSLSTIYLPISILLTLINLKAVILTTRAYRTLHTAFIFLLGITFIASWLLYGEFYDSSHLSLIPTLLSFFVFFFISYLSYFHLFHFYNLTKCY